MLDARYAWYEELRAGGPVHRHHDGYWAVVSYEDVRRVLAEVDTFSSDPATRATGGPVVTPVVGGMITTDPPRHDRLRSLIQPAFAPPVVQRRREHTERLVDELLDAVCEGGAMDVVADFAYRLPAMSIAHLLGVSRDDHHRFLGWTNAVLDTQASGIGGGAPAEVIAERDRLRTEMHEYFARAIEDRRRRGGDDLIATLVAAESSTEPLSGRELLDFCNLLVFAGHATTMNLIANAVRCFDEWPQARDRVRADPSLLPRAMEEVLRYRSPVHRVMRFARHRTTLGGQTIDTGDRVVPYIGAANRDPQRFEDPATFDIDRHPNPHVGFGHGIHFCIGAPLARLEAPIALRGLYARMPDISIIDPSALEEIGGVSLHGVRALPVRFTPSPRAGALAPT